MDKNLQDDDLWGFLRENWVVDGLTFKMTSPAFPEQYDVFDDAGQQVGYVRLRNGRMYCDCPDIGGERIYEVRNADMKYEIWDEEEPETLQMLAKLINDWRKKYK